MSSVCSIFAFCSVMLVHKCVIYSDNISHFGLSVCFRQIKRLVVFWCIFRFFAIQKKNGSTNVIHNWSIQPFSQDYYLSSHTTYVVCINFVHERRHLQFTVDSERQIFEKLFMVILLLCQKFCQSFCYIFVFDVWSKV